MAYVNGNCPDCNDEGGGDAVTESTVQVNIPWVDISAANGTLARAGAVTSKALFVKSGNQVTMHLKHFTLGNATGQRQYMQTYYDFDEDLYPAEFPIPAEYRPVETIVQMIGRPGLVSNGKSYDGYLLIGQEGHLEINPTFEHGTITQPDGFEAGTTVSLNGYGIAVTWLIGPAFT